MPGPKTFTQAELNAVAAKERKQAEARAQEEINRLTSELEQHRTFIEAAKARIAELEAQVAAVAAERDAARAQLEAATVQHAEAIARHRQAQATAAITQALAAARVVPSAARIAAQEFTAAAELEQDDAGTVTAITYGGKRRPASKIVEAAEEFLRAHPYLALPPLGGGSGGSRNLIGSAPPLPAGDITEADPKELISEGWNTPSS